MSGDSGHVEIAGILNVTPDSFSDGGIHLDPTAAIERGLDMWESGAAWIDVGGESTRPGSEGVAWKEELRRVLPVVSGLAERGVAVSIDTSKPEVAKEALAAGAGVVNDVRALQAPGMVEAVSAAGAGAVLMHMRGTPRTMQGLAVYQDVVEEVFSFLKERVTVAREAGISLIWADPGIGFGKTTEQNAALLQRLPEFGGLGVPLYVGASRKRFVGELTGVDEPVERLAGSLGAAAAAARGGASVVRVHDVAETRRMLDVYLACSRSVEEPLP